MHPDRGQWEGLLVSVAPEQRLLVEQSDAAHERSGGVTGLGLRRLRLREASTGAAQHPAGICARPRLRGVLDSRETERLAL